MPEKIFIFYSSETEPDILSYYSEALSYLRQLKKNVSVIDVYKMPKAAKEHKIIATPTVIVQNGKKSKEYFGVVEGIKELLKKDIFGAALIHGASYREGRQAGQKCIGVKDREEIGRIIASGLSGKAGMVKVTCLDSRKAAATVEISYSSAKVDSCSNEVIAFIGGFFTEVFRKSVYAEPKMAMSKNTVEYTVK